MRGVVDWTSAAGTMAVLAIIVAGPMLAPPRAWARAGGFATGHASFNHGDFRRVGGQPFVRFRQMPPVVVSVGPAGINRTSGSEPVRLHRRIFGYGLPVRGIGISFGPFAEPVADVGAIDRSTGPRAVDDGSPIPEGGDGISVNRGGCRSETRTVSSEDGGERPIRITWCRKE